MADPAAISLLSTVDDGTSKGDKFSFRVFRYGRTLDFVLIGISIVVNFASGVLTPVFFLFFGDVIDGVSGPGTQGSDLGYLVKVQLICGAIAFVLCSIGAYTMEISAERQYQQVKTGFLQSLMRQEMGWFDEFDPGKLSSTLSQNCVVIRDGIGIKLAQLFMFLGMFLGGYGVGFYRSWKMTLVLIAAVPVMIGSTLWMMRSLANSDSVARKAYASAAGVVEETLLSIKTVVSFGLESRALSLFTSHLDESYKAGIKTSLAIGVSSGTLFGFFYWCEALGFWFAGKLIADDLDEHGLACWDDNSGVDCFKGGKAFSVFFGVIIGAFAMGQAGPAITALSKATTAMSELDAIISRQSTIDPINDDKPAIPRNELRGKIEFKNVSFAYPTRKERQVFRDFNLTIEPEKSIALVGGSGCGKSTCVQLVERFYDVDGGSVMIDGKDLRDISLRGWRGCVSLVSQEPRLFATSVRENIRIGRLEATDEEVEMAAKQANAHNFIADFPDGYNTFVGEGGGQLSGGQKQRIAIARAILRNPAVLILDEATSALDNESEKIVQQTLDDLVESSKRTTIIIAHRLSTIRKADRIVVLENLNEEGSRVVESGTHDELMRIEKGLYRALVEAQSLSANAEDEDELNAAELAADIATDLVDLPRHSQSLVKLQSKFSRASSKGGSKGGSIIPLLDSSEKKKEKGPGSFRKVIKLLSPHKWLVAMGIIGAIANGSIFPIYSIFFSKIVAAFFEVDADDVRSTVLFWAIMLLVLGASSFVAGCTQNLFFTLAGVRVVFSLRQKLFDSILYQDMGFFDNPENSLGVLSDMLAGDTVLVKGFVGDNLGIYIQNAVCVIGALIVTFTASAKLGGVAVASFAMMAPAQIIESQFTMPVQEGVVDPEKVHSEKDTETTTFVLQETVVNIRTVGAYTLEDEMDSKYRRIVDAQYRSGIRRAIMTGFAWGLSQFATYGCQTLLLWYGGKLVSDGEIETDQMLRGMLALMMAAMSVGQSMVLFTDTNKGRSASDRIYTVLERTPAVDSRSLPGESKSTFEGIENHIEFQKIKFVYPARPTQPIYSNVSFRINKGELVALVGQSGCGKSTVVQILERFYAFGEEDKPEEERHGNWGSIKVDDRDIRDYNVRSLRSKLGLVSQEPNLFDVSIRENIGLGRSGEEIPFSQIEQAARAANAYDFVQKFDQGFDTHVGRFGGQLSGGQKQRVAIARAIIRNPEILLLDEATSALDAESEEIVQAALDKLIETQKRTTLVIAHRLSTIKKADKIVVLVNKGHGSAVAEVGTHNELLKIENGVYKKLVQFAEGSS